MPDLFHFSEEMERYFESLSPQLQQTIQQSNAKIGCVEDMRQLVEQLENRQTFS